jgi:hypothetical protein
MAANEVDLMSSIAGDIEYPSTFAPLTEARAVLEVASFFAYRTILEKMSPVGDGHPVITLPPFMSDDVTENIRLSGSHTGLPFNLPVLYAVADRLAKPANNCKPFSFHGA